MAVYSMTGYASVQREAPADGLPLGTLVVELRSVNGRFLDVTPRLADELRSHEPLLRELLAARLKRGKVELRVSLETGAADTVRGPDPHLLQRLSTLQEHVRAWLPDARSLGVADVLRLCASEGAQRADWSEPLHDAVTQALGDLVDAREREGARLATMLLGHLQRLRALAQQAQPLVPQLVEQQRARFLERFRDAVRLADGEQASDAAQERALAEAAAFAMRIDVAEELTRLASHLDEIERLVRGGGEIGKRLDFLIQELHREANTLGSKSAVLELTRIAVDMKVLIEQMREQVQNIE